jgi:hypothetical protein
MIPDNNDTRESYIELMKATYLDIAERHHNLGNNLSMWQHLFTWAMCEELYGDHWDSLVGKRKCI